MIIQETCMPEPGTISARKEKDLRAEDLNMGAIFNARERTVHEWKELCAQADPRFVMGRVSEPPGSALGIIEFTWEEAA